MPTISNKVYDALVLTANEASNHLYEKQDIARVRELGAAALKLAEPVKKPSKKRDLVYHWMTPTQRSFCSSKFVLNVVPDKLKVTCRSCIRLMKLHGHYTCESCGKPLDGY